MKKKFNVIKLSGLRGLLLIAFIGACLLTGFLVFPGWVCMHVWNYAGSFFLDVPAMNIVHGVILWCIIALSIYALNKGNVLISFNSVSPSEERLRQIMNEDRTELIHKARPNTEELSEEQDKVTK